MPWVFHRWLVWLAFAGLLVVGLRVYRDYGISWDEETVRRLNGLPNCLFLAGGDPHVLKDRSEKYHGPAFEIVLFLPEVGLGLEDTRDVFCIRQLMTFLVFFAGAVVLYWTTGACPPAGSWRSCWP